MMPRMNDLSIEVVACFVGLVLVALFANIIFRRLRFPCTIGLIFVGLALFKVGGDGSFAEHSANDSPDAEFHSLYSAADADF
jgi:Kef-type K+ transport system membrane component KefB